MNAMARFLHADDEMVSRELISPLPQAEGYRVDASGDGAGVWPCLPGDAEHDLMPLLAEVARAAQAKVFEYRRQQEEGEAAEWPFEFLRDGVFHFRSLDENRLLGRLPARACPDPGHAVRGL